MEIVSSKNARIVIKQENQRNCLYVGNLLRPDYNFVGENLLMLNVWGVISNTHPINPNKSKRIKNKGF